MYSNTSLELHARTWHYVPTRAFPNAISGASLSILNFFARASLLSWCNNFERFEFLPFSSSLALLSARRAMFAKDAWRSWRHTKWDPDEAKNADAIHATLVTSESEYLKSLCVWDSVRDIVQEISEILFKRFQRHNLHHRSRDTREFSFLRGTTITTTGEKTTLHHAVIVHT